MISLPVFLGCALITPYAVAEPRDADRITVTKTVINRTGMPTPATPFQVRVDCWPTGSVAIVILRSSEDFTRTVPVRPGSQCRISELPPPPPTPCRWITRYPGGQDVRPGRVARLINELRCEGIGGRFRRYGGGTEQAPAGRWDTPQF